MLSVVQNAGHTLEEKLHLSSHPLGIKLLDKKELIPPSAHRPLRDFGFHLSLCQGFTISRREGKTIAMLKEDMWCFYPVIGYGFADPPEYFWEGNTNYPGKVSNQEAGATWARALPRVKKQRTVCVLSAPLNRIEFVPDVVLVYCDSAQLTHLVKAIVWKDGHDVSIQPRLASSAACVYSVVQPFTDSAPYALTLPCPGERKRALAYNDELIFSFKPEKLEQMVKGLNNIEHYKYTFSATPLTCRPEHELGDAYRHTAKLLGMDVQ